MAFLILCALIGAIIFHVQNTPENKEATQKKVKKLEEEKEQEEAINNILKSIPKCFCSDNLDKKDATHLNNLIKGLDLYEELADLGFIDQVKEKGDRAFYRYQYKRYPVKYNNSVDYVGFLTSSHIIFTIMSHLYVIAPYIEENVSMGEDLNEKELKNAKRCKKLLFKLIDKLKISRVPLREEDRELLSKTNDEVYAKITKF